jgi:hypothetical protein
MIVADDSVREWGTADWAEKSAEYSEMGYVPISMEKDFAKIYPDTITKAAEQYVEKEQAVESVQEAAESESEEELANAA